MGSFAYRDKKVVGVFVRFSCAASLVKPMHLQAVLSIPYYVSTVAETLLTWVYAFRI
jgi:hypothetical protein